MANNSKTSSMDIAFDKFCEMCLSVISFLFISVFGFAITNLWKYKNKRILISLTMALIISGAIYVKLLGYEKLYCATPVLIYLLISAIVFKIENLINGSRSKTFELINFKDKSGNYPRIIKVQKFKSKKSAKKTKVLIIRSMIPFHNWKNNKELLENAFNSKVSLRQTGQKQIIKLFVGV